MSWKNECIFCGSEYNDENALCLCYGCRITLPALAKSGVKEAAEFLLALKCKSSHERKAAGIIFAEKLKELSYLNQVRYRIY